MRARSPGRFAVPPAQRRAERAGSVGVRVHCLNFEPVAALGEPAFHGFTSGRLVAVVAASSRYFGTVVTNIRGTFKSSTAS